MIWLENKINKLNFVKTVLENLIHEQPIEEMKKDPARWDMIFHAIKAVEDIETMEKKELEMFNNEDV
tara:strand:+ start:180 stop:380 length:201 start_codon:yes stop_codon:yes gene_type:complete